MAEKEFKGLILEPQTIDDYFHNVKFQLTEVKYYLGCSKYLSALIKAQCMVRELEALVDAESQLSHQDKSEINPSKF